MSIIYIQIISIGVKIMAVYRSDQAQLTFAAEAAQGGDPEMMEGTVGSYNYSTIK